MMEDGQMRIEVEMDHIEQPNEEVLDNAEDLVNTNDEDSIIAPEEYVVSDEQDIVEDESDQDMSKEEMTMIDEFTEGIAVADVNDTPTSPSPTEKN